MAKLIKKVGLIALLMLVFTSIGASYAPPVVPQTIYGDVTINGEPAPPGTVVEAKIGGITFDSTVVPAEGGIYALDVEGGTAGDTVDLYVDGVWAAETPFVAMEVTHLNLNITGEVVIEGFDIELFEGWNLIGLPFAPENSSIEVVLADILDNIVIVYAFSGESQTYLSYIPGLLELSDLTEMVEDKGYWIEMEHADTLTVYS